MKMDLLRQDANSNSDVGERLSSGVKEQTNLQLSRVMRLWLSTE